MSRSHGVQSMIPCAETSAGISLVLCSMSFLAASLSPFSIAHVWSWLFSVLSVCVWVCSQIWGETCFYFFYFFLSWMLPPFYWLDHIYVSLKLTKFYERMQKRVKNKQTTDYVNSPIPASLFYNNNRIGLMFLPCRQLTSVDVRPMYCQEWFLSTDLQEWVLSKQKSDWFKFW